MPNQSPSNRKILFNHVPAACHYLPRIPKARWSFSRLCRAVYDACLRQARQQRRPHRSLQVHCRIVTGVPDIVPNRDRPLQEMCIRDSLSPSCRANFIAATFARSASVTKYATNTRLLVASICSPQLDASTRKSVLSTKRLSLIHI